VLPVSYIPSARLRDTSRSGGTLIESLIALSILVILLAGSYAANGHVWGLLRSSLESIGANRVLNSRAEQLRAATWNQFTDAAYLRDAVFAVAPDAASDLGGLLETIDVSAYPVPTLNPAPLQVQRNNTTGAATAVGMGDGRMPEQPSLRVNLTASWVSKGGRPRTRQITLVFCKGGISGRK